MKVKRLYILLSFRLKVQQVLFPEKNDVLNLYRLSLHTYYKASHEAPLYISSLGPLKRASVNMKNSSKLFYCFIVHYDTNIVHQAYKVN